MRPGWPEKAEAEFVFAGGGRLKARDPRGIAGLDFSSFILLSSLHAVLALILSIATAHSRIHSFIAQRAAFWIQARINSQ